MNLFVDTSAMVKLYHQEKGTDSFTNLLNSHSSDLVITIADITRIEFRSAFLKRVRVKEIGLDTARKLFEAFDNDVQMFNSIEIDDVVKSLAIQLMDSVAYQIPLRALDAIQLSAAIASHRVVTVDFFVACDKGLLKVAGHYFHTFNPEIEII